MLGLKHPPTRGRWNRSRYQKRRGTILILAAFLMIVMMAMLALTVDMGYMMTVQTEMKRATDAAALAGAGTLIEGSDLAELRAFEFLARNPVGAKNLMTEENWLERLGTLYQEHADEIDVKVGHWDPETRAFSESSIMPSTIQVTATQPNTPFFFAQVLGMNSFSVTAESVARYQPRDIVLVLDFSGSMNDDSELKMIDWYGNNREVVESSLLECYQDLGSPNYGSLEFQPRYVTMVGAPPSSPQMPQITVQFRSDDVYVTSTKDLSNIVMEFHDGWREKIEGLSSTTGAFRGTGYNYNKRITKVWVKSGPNDSGDGPGYGEGFEDTYDVIKQAFGLDSVPYPYASGSWDDFIYYVKTNSNVQRAGYRRMYGFMTLINYWLEQKPCHYQTSDLWKCNAQPVGAVKNSTGVFMDYIQEVDTEDRVSLVLYNSSSETALVEHSLTEDFDAVENTVQHRQAGHYNTMTNIGDGIRYARQELDANARTGAFKLIVLMTDGQANRPYGVDPRQYALQQAQLAANARYPIVTISLGSSADTSLMQQIADLSNGAHFNIPGLQLVTNYEDDLLAVFRKIADDRPLVLVK